MSFSVLFTNSVSSVAVFLFFHLSNSSGRDKARLFHPNQQEQSADKTGDHHHLKQSLKADAGRPAADDRRQKYHRRQKRIRQPDVCRLVFWQGEFQHDIQM